MAISHVGSISGSGNTTTSLTITINVATAAGDIILVSTTNGGSDSSPTVAGTVVTTGGVAAFASVVEATDTGAGALNGKLWWTRAVGNHNTQTVAIAGATDSCAGNVTILRGCVASGSPHRATNTALIDGANADTISAVNANGVPGCWLVLALCCDDNIADSAQAATDPSTITERAEHSSGGGADTNNSIAAAAMSGTGSTGAITWTNARASGIFQIALAAIIAPEGANTPTAGNATATGVAREPDADIGVRPGVATATGAANAATVLTGQNAAAGHASATAGAFNATVAIGPGAGHASAVGNVYSTVVLRGQGKIETIVETFATDLGVFDNDFTDGVSVVGGRAFMDPTLIASYMDASGGVINVDGVDVYDLTDSYILAELELELDPAHAQGYEFNTIDAITFNQFGFLVRYVGGTWRLQDGQTQGSVLDVAYNATDHRWLRIRESGGTLFWDAAPDGSTWTNLGSTSTPAGATQVYPYFFLSQQDSDSWMYVDNVNNVTAADTAPAGHASATGSAFGPSGGITVNAGHASASATAHQATALVTDNFIMPAATAAAHSVTANVAPTAGHAAASGAAFNATVSTVTHVTANAGHASATADANPVEIYLGQGKTEIMVETFAVDFGDFIETDNATVTGGRAVLDATTGLAFIGASVNASQTRYMWDLTDSYWLVEHEIDFDGTGISYYPLNLIDGASEITIRVVWDPTPGEWVLDFRDDNVSLSTIPYDAVAHRWLRVRETGGVIFYETSPDGAVWTTQESDTPASDPVAVYPFLAVSGTGATILYLDNINNPPAQTNAPAGHASATGSAGNVSAALGISGGHSSASGTANNPTASLTTNAGNAGASGAAGGPSSALTVTPTLASATGSAFDATVTTSSNATAPAGHASASAGAFDATIAITVSPGHAAGTGTAFDATVATTTNVQAFAGHASATAQAFDATTTAEVTPPTPEAPAESRPGGHRVANPRALADAQAWREHIVAEDEEILVLL